MHQFFHVILSTIFFCSDKQLQANKRIALYTFMNGDGIKHFKNQNGLFGFEQNEYNIKRNLHTEIYKKLFVFRIRFVYFEIDFILNSSSRKTSLAETPNSMKC